MIYHEYLNPCDIVAAIPDKINNPFEDAKKALNSPEPTAEAKKKEAQILATNLRKRHPVARPRTHSGINKDKALLRKTESLGVSSTPSNKHTSQSPNVNTLEPTNGAVGAEGGERMEDVEGVSETNGIVLTQAEADVHVPEEKENDKAPTVILSRWLFMLAIFLTKFLGCCERECG